MSAIWATGTNTAETGGAATVLYTGEFVEAPVAYDSPSGQFRLQFQVEGNLVLLSLPDETVLWASGPGGDGGDTLIMQEDGNLVIYDGGIFGTPTWSSETGEEGNENAYLVLQNDGNLVIYTPVGLQPLGVFTIPPDWRDGSIETLSWLTSTTESPQAVEQRMGLRISPRQMFEYSYTIFNRRRSHFDLLNMAAAGSPFYLPIWHDKAVLTSAIIAGATVLNLDTQYTEFQNCTVAVLLKNEYDYELVEIESFTNSSITLTGGTSRAWPINSLIYPCKTVRVETQLSGDRHADEAFRGRMRFQSLEKNDSNAEFEFELYLDNPVLEDEPNENGGVQYRYNRKEYLLDTNVGLQLLSDVAPFINQNHSWFAKGRERAWRLRGLLYALQGKRRPIWVPSFFADFELAEASADDQTNITVRRCGYSDTGGPFTHRDHILIHMRDGSRLYRKIVDAAIIGDDGEFEIIGLNGAHGVDLTPDNVLRISFVTFCRLDQDSIELVHHSDSKGVTTATLVWRTDPGIGGTYSETVTEIPDLNPEDPDLPEIFDPFRLPDQMLLGYSPFASLGHAEPPQPDPPTPATFAWQQFVPDEEVGFPHDLIEIETGNDGFSLPLTGSFKISMMSWFDFDFFIPNFVRFWIELENTTLDPFEVELEIEAIDDPVIFHVGGDRYRTTAPLVIPTIGRMSVGSVVVDPDQPIVIRAYHTTEGFLVDTGGPILGGNSFAAPSEDGVIEPYTEGDSFMKIEWWDS